MQRESLFMRQYYDIFSNERSMSSHEEYYRALVRFIRRNDRYFSKKILAAYELNTLITLDLEKYVIDPAVFSMEVEKEKYSTAEYTSISSLAMSISFSLWEMIAVYSGNDCPITGEYNMRYVLVEDADSKKFLLEECEQCGCLRDQAGTEYTGTIEKITPASSCQVMKRKSMK